MQNLGTVPGALEGKPGNEKTSRGLFSSDREAEPDKKLSTPLRGMVDVQNEFPSATFSEAKVLRRRTVLLILRRRTNKGTRTWILVHTVVRIVSSRSEPKDSSSVRYIVNCMKPFSFPLFTDSLS